MIIFTINPKKLIFSDQEWFTIHAKETNIAIRRNRFEFEVNYDKLTAPNADVWFLVNFEFEFARTDRKIDSDSIISNGEEYYLVNTSLVSSKRKKLRFVLNEQTKNEIDNSISKFVSTL